MKRKEYSSKFTFQIFEEKYVKKDLIREKILHHAQILFQQYGLKKTTMDEIALESGKAKSTIYHYFKNKDEVIRAVVEMEMINLRKYVKNKVEDHKSMLDKLRTYFFEFHKEVINRFTLYRFIQQEQKLEQLGSDIFEKMMEYEKSYIARIIEDGYDSGEFKSFEKENIPWLAELVLAAFLGVVRHLIIKEGELDLIKLKSTADILLPRIFS